MLREHVSGLLHTLFDYKCFVFPEPGSPGFRRAVHDRYPSVPLPLAPGYFDIRQLMSHPGAYRYVAGVMAATWRMEFARIQRLSDIRGASTPLVAMLTEVTGIPMISPRLTKKTHGILRTIGGGLPVW